jgi:predicted ATP-grasp superfamily ATP-dependent carboligase
MKTHVLLTCGWVRSTYAALRNLHSHRLTVAVADTALSGMCQQSRLKSAFFRYSNPFKNESRFVTEVSNIFIQNPFLVLLPSHDETEIIARHLTDLPSGVIVPIPGYDQICFANDKAKTHLAAQKIGLSTPRRFFWETYDDLQKVVSSPDNVSIRKVVRLRRSHSAKGIYYPRSNEELISQVKFLVQRYGLSAERYPLVQQYVDGEGWGVSCLYWHGEHIASFTHKRLREKTSTGGTSTLREHQPNQVLEKMANSLLSSLGWHGLAMVEFKYDSVTHNAWFIEINPRLWGSLHLAVSAGVEFPYLLYLAATSGPQAARDYHARQTVKYPWKARWYLGDWIIAAARIRKGNFVDALKLIIPGGTDTYDDINCHDPGAFGGELIHYGLGFLKSGSLNPVQDGILG